MKRLLVLLFSVPFVTFAQLKHLVAEGASPALYLTHTVQAKENYYSIGRLYNISPKDIAPFNNFQLEKGLSLHQIIKIPLNSNNFLQSGNPATDEVLVPVHHVLQTKESLYRVGITYNKLPLETLKKWNNIKGESVPNGRDLIIGYLKVKKTLSALASGAKIKEYDNAVVEPAVAIAAPVVKKDVAVVPKAKEAVLIKDISTTEPEPETPKTTTPKAKEPVFIKDISTTDPEHETTKTITPVAKVSEPVKPAIYTNVKSFNGGIFKKEFDTQAKRPTSINEAGSAATFKSNSGWEDGKYYCLHNSAPSGTVLKITNVATGKLVYAKVLDVMPDIKQNGGLLVRLSNAAAQELGVTDARFDCTVSYSK